MKALQVANYGMGTRVILEFLLSGFLTTATTRQIQRFVKGGAYFSSRSLKQGVWVTQYPMQKLAIGLLYFKSKNDINHEICIALTAW